MNGSQIAYNDAISRADVWEYPSENMESRMSDALNAVLLKMHEGCRQQEVAHFKNWALDLTTTVVPFSIAYWANAVIVDGKVHMFNTYVRGVDEGYAQCLEEHVHLDVRMQENYANIGKTILRDGHDPKDTPPEFRRLVLDPYRIRFATITLFMDRPTCVFDGIVLMRDPKSAQFSEHERSLVQSLVPHLHQIRVANQIERGCDVLDAGNRAMYHTVISDNDGLVMAADVAATKMLLLEWPGWSGGRLPQPLVEAIATANQEQRPGYMVRKQLVARLYPDPNQTLVRLRTPNAVESLGPRELAVAEYYGSGASYKEIAKTLGLSPSTVSNQLASVYVKLGVSNKGELVYQLDQWR